MEQLYSLVTIASNNYDMELLPWLWNLSLSKKEDGEVLRAIIKSRIPAIASFYDITPSENFIEFTKHWNEVMLDLECDNHSNPILCIRHFIKKNDMNGILHVMNKYTHKVDWKDACIAAINNKVFVELFFNKLEQTIIAEYQELDQYYDREDEQRELVNKFFNIFIELIDAAVLNDAVDVVKYLVRKSRKYFTPTKQYHLELHIFKKAVELGNYILVDKYLPEKNDEMFIRSTDFALAHHQNDMAEHLLELGANKQYFSNGIVSTYNVDLIKKYIQDIDYRDFEELVKQINDRKDDDMIDFITANRPEIFK